MMTLTIPIWLFTVMVILSIVGIIGILCVTKVLHWGY